MLPAQRLGYPQLVLHKDLPALGYGIAFYATTYLILM